MAGIGSQLVSIPSIELVGGDVERNGDFVAGPEPGLFDRPQHQLQHRFVAGDIRPETAFVGDPAQTPGVGKQ